MEDYILIYDNTPLLKLEDETYPHYFPEVRLENSNTSFPNPIRDYILEPFGYVPTMDTEKPEGDVVDEGQPVQHEDGKWYKTWTSRPYNEEELAYNLEERKILNRFYAKQNFDRDILENFFYTFDGVKHRIYLTDEEISYLLLSQKMLVGEDETVVYQFADGKFISLNFTDYNKMVSDFAKIYYDVKSNYWGYLNLVYTAQLISDVPDVPETFVGGDFVRNVDH